MTSTLERLVASLDELFSDGGIHPVVYRSATKDGGLTGPIVEPSLQRCAKCVKALFDVSEAYFTYKRETSEKKA